LSAAVFERLLRRIGDERCFLYGRHAGGVRFGVARRQLSSPGV
jgi:hypothetical protein